MTKYESIMAQVEILKAELEVLRAKHDGGMSDDWYRDEANRIDSKLCDLMMEVRNTRITLE